MADKIAVLVMEIDTEVSVNLSASSNLVVDGQGWHVLVNATQGQQAVFRLKATTAAQHALVLKVRAIDPEDESQEVWPAQNIGGVDYYVSPAYSDGTTFELEVDNSSNAGPGTRGGGHFRVLDEGAGGP